MGFRGKYLGGGWAVRVPEGQVRRRVVGEELGEGVSFELFGERSGEKGVIGEKSTFCYGDKIETVDFSAFWRGR